MPEITFSQEAKPSKHLDHLPIVSGFAHRLKIIETINTLCPRDPSQKVSHGECIFALVLSVLHQRHALYQVEEWLDTVALDVLFEREVESHHFNDTRLADALDAIHTVGIKAVFAAVVTTAIELYQVKTDRLHGDTSSVKVYGDYDQAPESSLRLLHGYSKDHRPDLKQLIFGLVVSNDGGVPLLGDLHSGNQSDHETNRFHIQQLRKYLPNLSKSTLLYDSKLCDAKTLGLAREANFHWITLVPQTHSIRDEVIEEMLEEGEDWPVLQSKPGKSAGELTIYSGKSLKKKMEVLINTKGKEECKRIVVRYLVVHSSQLERVHQHSLEKKIASEEKALQQRVRKLEKRHFACEKDLYEAMENAEKSTTVCYHQVVFEIEQGIELEKRDRTGRPRKGEAGKRVTYWHFRGKVVPDEEEIAAIKKKQGCFVLATSHLHPKDVSDAEILSWYKEQHKVEQGFHWLKGPAAFAPIFLKKPERILAMGLVFLLALMVYTLIERQIRKGLAECGEKIPGNNKVMTDRPTAAVLFKHFGGISLVWVWIEGHWKPVVPSLSKLQRYILEMLHLPAEVFLRSTGLAGVT